MLWPQLQLYHEQRLVIATEYLDALSLRDHLRHGQQLSEEVCTVHLLEARGDFCDSGAGRRLRFNG